MSYCSQNPIYHLLILILFTSDAFSWNQHTVTFMPWVLEGLSITLKEKISHRLDIPCNPDEVLSKQESDIFHRIVIELDLNPNHQINSLALDACKKDTGSKDTSGIIGTSGRTILENQTIDEPDRGMDENLEESMDKEQERKWMGGKSGPTSKGFRHMFFGGWIFYRPVSSFQFPLRALGQAPARAEALAKFSQQLFQEGLPIWGYRTLGWALHYIQDLAQPFHATQVPYLPMLAFSEIFYWPPNLAFYHFVKQSTRTIGNFHLAFEKYMEHQILVRKDESVVQCLNEAERYSTLIPSKMPASPTALAHLIAKESTYVANKLGRKEISFFGKTLKLGSHDLFKDEGSWDLKPYASNPEYEDVRNQFHEVSCSSLANAVMGSRFLIKWVLEQTPISK